VINRFLILILLFCIFPFCILGKSGSDIIATADGYRVFLWLCVDANARTSNADVAISNNDFRYPFYPNHVWYIDSSMNSVESNGWNTGVAYASGIGDTTSNFNSKLSGTNSGFLAGNYTDSINIQHYAGLDCSGFAARHDGHMGIAVESSKQGGIVYDEVNAIEGFEQIDEMTPTADNLTSSSAITLTSGSGIIRTEQQVPGVLTEFHVDGTKVVTLNLSEIDENKLPEKYFRK
jgi:hypothetical protein